MNQGKQAPKYATKFRGSTHALQNAYLGHEMEKLRRSVARADVLANGLHAGSTQ